MQAGGPKLAISTVHAFTGRPINHVIVVISSISKDLINALGGVTIDVPDAVLSNRFDCPYVDGCRVPAVAGLAVPEGAAAHERPAGAHLLADPGRTCSTRVSRPISSAPRASRP